ncbi:alpha/beta hydrolase [Burkholderia sp. PU8-34]
MFVKSIYREMNAAELDDAYNIIGATPGYERILADFQSRSRALYASSRCRRDIRYGQRPRQRYDWIPSDTPNAPTFVFIHGGYWQSCQKEDFAFVSAGPLSLGFNVVLAEYTLAPEASMTRIVSEIGMLLDHLEADRDQLGISRQSLYLCGHSAGGHLTAMHRSHPAVRKALPISALTDLEPIRLTTLNEKLGLSTDEVRTYSPVKVISPGAPTVIAVGSDELPELVRQSDDYANACRLAGEDVELVHVENCDHFSVLEELSRPDGYLLRSMRDI